MSDLARLAAQLSAIHGTLITALDPAQGTGFLVKETATHTIEVHRMLVNWRVCAVPKDWSPHAARFWCYGGTSGETMVLAVCAALLWDGEDDTEPPGWTKNGQTGELRIAGEVVL